MISLPRFSVNRKVWYHAIKKIFNQKCELDPRKFAECRPFRQVVPGFNMCSHTNRRSVKLFLCILRKLITVVNSRWLYVKFIYRKIVLFQYSSIIRLVWNACSVVFWFVG